MKPKKPLSVYEQILKAAKRGRGIRLSEEEVQSFPKMMPWKHGQKTTS